MVMTSGPGVGKTTIVKAILRILAAKGSRRIAMYDILHSRKAASLFAVDHRDVGHRPPIGP